MSASDEWENEHSYSVLSASISPNERTGLQGVERLDAVICQFLREQNVPGATLAVAKHGCLVYEQGYGVAGAGRRMRAGMMLRVASISKPITAIAVMRLCQEGRLSLDAKVFGSNGILKRLRPHGDKRLKQVTVRHLLQHSAGWDRDIVSDAVFENVALPDGMERTSARYNAHLLQRILFRKLQFTPGSRHAYSNLGYLVLGEVIEAVTGQSYERYLQSLLAAIGITGMYVGREERASWRSSEGEYFNIREPSTAPSVIPRQPDSQVLPQYGSFLMRNTGAYGGWVASARDLVNVLCCLEEAAKGRLEDGVSGSGMQQCESPDPVLNASSVSAMLECPSYESGGGGDWYGLGLDVQDRGQTWGHTGAMEGTSATCQRHHSGLIWAFVLNAWTSNMDLDGVVKSALSAVPHLSPFPVHLAQVCGRKELQVQTADQQQCIVMHVPLHRLFPLIMEKNNEGFTTVWVSASTVMLEEGNGVDFNVVFTRSSALLGEKLVLLIEVSHLSIVLKRCTEEGVYPELITTYVSCGTLQAVVILAVRSTGCVSEVDVCVPVGQFLPLLTQRKKNGFSVISQCVLQCPDSGQLLVTAIMKKEENTNALTNSSEEVNVAKKTEGEDKRSVATDDKESLRIHTEGAQNKQTEHRECGKIEHCDHFENERTNIESSISAESESDCYLTSDKDCKTEDVAYFDAEKSENSVSEGVTNPRSGERWEEDSLDFANESGGDLSCESVGHPGEGRTRSSCASLEGRQSPLCVYPSPFDTSDTLDKTDCRFQKECEKSNRSPVLDKTDCDFQNACEKSDPSPTGAKVVSSPTKRKTNQRPVSRLKILSYVQLEVDSFVTEMGRQAKHGCGLQNVHFFPVDGKWYVSAIWSPACTHNSYHRMAVSHLGLLPALAEAAARNVRLKFVCQYEEEGATYYALFWEGPPFVKVTRKRKSSVS